VTSPTADRRVVVTGLGATTPLGGDVPSTWAAMLAGRSGVRRLPQEFVDVLPVHIGAPVAVDPLDPLPLVGALVYSAIGLALFGLVWFLIVKLSPFSIRKEIEEDQNTALGIIIGAVILGIALIISSAIRG